CKRRGTTVPSGVSAHVARCPVPEGQDILPEPEEAAIRGNKLGPVAERWPVPLHAPVESDDPGSLNAGGLAFGFCDSLVDVGPELPAEAIRVLVQLPLVTSASLAKIARGNFLWFERGGRVGNVLIGVIEGELGTGGVQTLAEVVFVKEVVESFVC